MFESFCKVNGIDICYRDTGAGEPIVLIHGLGSHGGDWSYQQDHFSPRFRVISFDLRGHGNTGCAGRPYSVSQFSSDVTGLLDALNIESAHVVGLSLGGMVAFQMGVDTPRRVRSLTVINSAPAVEYRTLLQKIGVWHRIFVIRVLGMRALGKLISRRLFPLADQKKLARQFIDHMEGCSKDSYISALRSFLGWSVSSQLSALTMPVLVVSGDRDYTSVAHKKRYVDQIGGARLSVIKNSGHATPLDQPRALNLVIDQFLHSQLRSDS